MLLYGIDLPHSILVSPRLPHNAMVYCQLLFHQCIVKISFELRKKALFNALHLS
jgi:hypothetical protein